MRSFVFAALPAILVLTTGAAMAQAPAAAPTMDKAALSKSCSQQADAKALHGKARKHFRSQCKHGY